MSEERNVPLALYQQADLEAERLFIDRATANQLSDALVDYAFGKQHGLFINCNDIANTRLPRRFLVFSSFSSIEIGEPQ